MSALNRHPTALIHPAARLAADLSVGPYAIIEEGVEIGGGTRIGEHAVIRCGSVIGADCQIDAHAVIGGLPQDLGFNPQTASGVRLGDGVIIREGVTINRATRAESFTEIGARAFLMACSHVGHDCKVGSDVILANAVLLGGHVQIGDFSFVGGGAAVHQFVRIGEGVMIGGVSRVSQDVPAFTLMAERNELLGLNLVGLQRRGAGREEIRELKRLYHGVFSSPGRPRLLAERLWQEGAASSPRGQRFLQFLMGESRKGMIRPVKIVTEPGLKD